MSVPDFHMEQDFTESEEEVTLKEEETNEEFGGGNGLGLPVNQEPEPIDDMVF